MMACSITFSETLKLFNLHELNTPCFLLLRNSTIAQAAKHGTSTSDSWLWTKTWLMKITEPRVLMSSPSHSRMDSVRICSSSSFRFRTSWHWAWCDGDRRPFQTLLSSHFVSCKVWLRATVCLTRDESCSAYRQIFERRHALLNVWPVWMILLKERNTCYTCNKKLNTGAQDRLLSTDTHLHVSLKLFKQVGVFVQSHKGFTETCGQGEDPRTDSATTFHKLSQYFTVRKPKERQTISSTPQTTSSQGLQTQLSTVTFKLLKMGVMSVISKLFFPPNFCKTSWNKIESLLFSHILIVVQRHKNIPQKWRTLNLKNITKCNLEKLHNHNTASSAPPYGQYLLQSIQTVILEIL